MNILDISEFRKSYGPKKILDGISLTVGETEKVGLIGRNGSGKTTLLRLAAGLEPPDEGRIAYKRGITVGYLPQEPVFDADRPVSEEIESGLAEIRRKVDRHHAISSALSSAAPSEIQKLLKEQEDLGSWIDHHGGWETGHRIDEALLRLGVADRNARVLSLSGGMKKRVALARLVLQSPDLLLLDEPTNHLDAATAQWLEDFLISYPGAVMLITHDRYFLDRVALRIFELQEGRLYAYRGGYSEYLEARAERLENEQRAQGRLMNLLRRESEWIARGPKARQTKQKARIQRYEEMQGQWKETGDRDIGLRLESRHRLGNTILEAVYLRKAYGGDPLIENLSFALRAGDRIGIIGPNGSGKTTLLKMLLGEEHPSSGNVVRGKNTRFAYFDQHRESLDQNIRVEDALGEGYWVTLGGERRHKTAYLSEFLFEPSDQKRLIRTLSGGEKARLMLARMMLEDANVLILDEPTNDLDIPTLQLLDDCLIRYQGCVLMVTHDRFFLDKVATMILSFEGHGRVRITTGNFENYRDELRKEAEGLKSVQESRSAASGRVAETESVRRRKGLTYQERLDLAAIEKEIEGLETKKRELERCLADPADAGREKIQKWGEELSRVEQSLSESMSRWEILEGKRMES